MDENEVSGKQKTEEIKDLKLLPNTVGSYFCSKVRHGREMGKCYYCGQREESELIAQALMVSYHPHQKQLWEVRGAQEAKRQRSLQSGGH